MVFWLWDVLLFQCYDNRKNSVCRVFIVTARNNDLKPQFKTDFKPRWTIRQVFAQMLSKCLEDVGFKLQTLFWFETYANSAFLLSLIKIRLEGLDARAKISQKNCIFENKDVNCKVFGNGLYAKPEYPKAYLTHKCYIFGHS